MAGGKAEQLESALRAVQRFIKKNGTNVYETIMSEVMIFINHAEEGREPGFKILAGTHAFNAFSKEWRITELVNNQLACADVAAEAERFRHFADELRQSADAIERALKAIE